MHFKRNSLGKHPQPRRQTWASSSWNRRAGFRFDQPRCRRCTAASVSETKVVQHCIVRWETNRSTQHQGRQERNRSWATFHIKWRLALYVSYSWNIKNRSWNVRVQWSYYSLSSTLSSECLTLPNTIFSQGKCWMWRYCLRRKKIEHCQNPIHSLLHSKHKVSN